MDLALHNRWALITESSRGIGELIARTLAREGAKVVIHGRDARRVEAVAAAIRKSGHVAGTLIGDLASDAEAEWVARKVTAGSRGIDILVNAGAHPSEGSFDAAAGTWRAQYEAEVPSARRMIQALVPGMLARGWGRVINVASGQTLRDLTSKLSQALAGTGVTANSVSAGVISVGVEDILRRGFGDGGSACSGATSARNWLDQVIADGTLQRMPAPRELAELIVFVASPRADGISGASLVIESARYGSRRPSTPAAELVGQVRQLLELLA